jgi:hypothetical protein
MTKQTPPDSAWEARAKALAALIDAVDVYKAFQTLELIGLRHDECGDGLDDAVCDAAGDLLDADAALADALEEQSKAQPKPKAPKEGHGTLESVKAAILAAQKRGVRTEVVQKVVMEHGGKARNPDIGIEGPSLKALPESQFAACIAVLQTLPITAYDTVKVDNTPASG